MGSMWDPSAIDLGLIWGRYGPSDGRRALERNHRELHSVRYRDKLVAVVCRPPESAMNRATGSHKFSAVLSMCYLPIVCANKQRNYM